MKPVAQVAGAAAHRGQAAEQRRPHRQRPTLGEEAALAKEKPGQEVVVHVSKPLKPWGGLVILQGNLAPEGCVVKLVGHKKLFHRGPARCFDSEEDAFAAVQEGSDQEGRRGRHPL